MTNRAARPRERAASIISSAKSRQLPVFVLWGNNDRVIPLASAEALVGTGATTHIHTVPGDHGWLISDPGLFAEVLTNVFVDDTEPPEAVGL